MGHGRSGCLLDCSVTWFWLRKSDNKNTEALEASYTNCFVYPFLLTLIEFSYTKYNYGVVNLEAFKRLFKWILTILNNLRNIERFGGLLSGFCVTNSMTRLWIIFRKVEFDNYACKNDRIQNMGM